MPTLDDARTLVRVNGSDLAARDIVAVFDDSADEIRGLPATDIPKIPLPVYTVATLPSAAAHPYVRAFVSDSTVGFSAAMLATVPEGGDTNFVPVYSDGAAWLIG